MDEFGDSLITEVRKYPLLYRNKEKTHNTLARREVCWRKIAFDLNAPVEDCKSRWRNIRDSYRKNRNRKLNGGTTNPFTSKYDDERLKFIDEGEPCDPLSIEIDPSSYKDDQNYVVEILPTQIEIPIETSPERPTSIPERSSEPGAKKRKHTETESLEIQYDKQLKMKTPVHTFFHSMADIVCNFPPDAIANLRLQVCNLVTKFELSILENRK